MIDFFRTNSLEGLDSRTRERTAQRIRFLRGSDAPAAVLADWFNGQPPAGLNAGSNLIAHAVAGNDARVRQVLQRRHAAYLRERVDLAQRVSDERAIRGLTRADLAAAADVDLTVLSAIERGKPVESIAAIRRVLRALHIDPSAIPAPGVR
ncbi:helix-turn-helix domain-containing protein [Cryobacterium sp. TMS1-20-1]|uniref:helix-turn-helix domain-containing protein n=1 Tax=Cryobacterium sp. TMS1-20-1 TaxID=1259223 RepID=UPI00141BD83E|nr:helix-turn-helix domain-containing protein [Cryobacterium sp. TMS1-20-1]